MFDLSDLADSINNASNKDEAWGAFAEQLRRQGLGRTALHTSLPLNSPNPFSDKRAGPSFGRVWDEKHDRRLHDHTGDLREASDPLLFHMRPTLRFFSLSREPMFVDHRRILMSPNETAFKPLCRIMIEDMGQFQGLALPLRDPATGTATILSAWGDEDRNEFSEFIQAKLETLHLLGYYLVGMLETKWPQLFQSSPQRQDELSDRERQVLACLACGMSTAQAADALYISDRSVNEYILRARKKLAARTRTEAVARATFLGMI